MAMEEKRVCFNCIRGHGIKIFILENAEEKGCDYCRRSSDESISVDIDFLESYFREIIEKSYDDVDDGALYDDDKRGFIIEPTLTENILFDELSFQLPNDRDQILIGDIIGLFKDACWVPKGTLDS